MSASNGNGKGIAFLRGLIGHRGDECVIWPLCRDSQNGYGRIGYLAKMHWAHRLMCQLAHGEPPTPGHEAAHSCGRGNEGCVNPAHLSWATKTRNQLDRRRHGTKSNAVWGWRGKLSEAQVEEIRALRGSFTQRAIAARFGISDATVRDIYSGKTRGADRMKNGSRITPDQVRGIASMRSTGSGYKEIAAKFGVSETTCYRICHGHRRQSIAPTLA